jgi:hypothetical protein
MAECAEKVIGQGFNYGDTILNCGDFHNYGNTMLNCDYRGEELGIVTLK